MMDKRNKSLATSLMPAIFSSLILPALFAVGAAQATPLIIESNNPPAESSVDTAVVAENPQDSEPFSAPHTSSSVNSELYFMIEELQMQIKALRGALEEQGNEIRHLKRNAKARYLDLDSRVQLLTKKVSSQSAIAVDNLRPASSLSESDINKVPEKNLVTKSIQEMVPKVPREASAQEKAFYQKSYNLIKVKKYEESVAKFYEFIDKYPDSPLAGNAYYWLGEVYLVLAKLEQARQAFSIVIEGYPTHGKVADTLFKLGETFNRLGKPVKAQGYLEEVQARFPNSTAAKLAKNYKINP